MSTNSKETAASRESAADDTAAKGAKPVYEKPRLRRYDQIDQVKPYGPSQL